MNAEKLVAKWREALPSQATQQEVEAVLKAFLEGRYRTGRSHYWVINVAKGHSFSVPVHNNRVKRPYLLHVLGAIDLVSQEREQEK